LPSAIDADFDTEMLASLASLLSPEDVQLYYQIALMGQRDLELAPDTRSGFEMLMLRMLTFRPVTTKMVTNNPTPVAISKPSIPSTPPPVTAAPVQLTQASGEQNWTAIIEQLNLVGPGKALANNCALDFIDDKVCSLHIDSSIIRGSLAEDMLQKALQAYYGKPLKLVFNSQKSALNTPAVQILKAREDKQQAAVDSINADATVQALKDNFDAHIVPNSIEPI
jgi:DNA polymerase-3 subunit gamma/tau